MVIFTLIQEIKADIVLPIENNDSKDVLTNYEFDGEVKEILNTALPIYILYRKARFSQKYFLKL